MNPIRTFGAALVGAVLTRPAFGPAELAAAPVQAVDLAAQGLGRGYWHVFVAYALAWVLVFGWAVFIGRRLAEVERRVDG